MLRYIISPTNDLNISDLQIALLNYIVAQQKNCNFLTIVDDVSKEYFEGAEQESIDILKKFAINTEQKVHRKDNLSIYQRFATKLVEDKKAFICFCDEVESKCNNSCKSLSNEQLKERLDNKEPYTIRLNESDNRELTILQKNQMPTSDFSTAIDNMISGITTIIASKKEKDSIDEQQNILKLLDYTSDIEYIYLKTEDKTATIKSLLQDGFLPDAIINYSINLLYPTPQELFYLPDAIKWLDLSKLNSTNNQFNLDELKALNRKHLLNMDSKKLSSIVGFADSDIGELLKLFLENLSTINELEAKFKQIFKPKDCKYDIETLKEISDIIKKSPIIENFEQFKEYIIKKSKLNCSNITAALIELLGVENEEEAIKVYPYIKSYILEVARCR